MQQDDMQQEDKQQKRTRGSYIYPWDVTPGVKTRPVPVHEIPEVLPVLVEGGDTPDEELLANHQPRQADVAQELDELPESLEPHAAERLA